MTAKKLCAVIIGCGSISSSYFSTLTKMEDITLGGVADIKRDAAFRATEQYGLDRAIIYDSIDKIMENVRPDIVFDCTIPQAHCQVTLKALRSGCHVLGEKPMSDSMKNAKRMVAAAQKTNRIYAVTQNYRYNPNIRALRRMIEKGIIGEINTVNADYYMAVHFGGFRAQMENPLLIEMSIHTFDAARLITGADPIAVYCLEYNPKNSWFKGNAATSAIFEMTNGIIFTYRGHWCAEGAGTGWTSLWRIVGTKGTIIWEKDQVPWAEIAKPKVTGESFSPTHRIKATPVKKKTGGHSGVIHDFVACIRNGKIPETVCTDNIKSLDMVFAAIESSKTKKRAQCKLVASERV